MPEQLSSDIEEDDDDVSSSQSAAVGRSSSSSSSSNSSTAAAVDTQEEEEFWSLKTMSQYARELICLLAFFLTTYATFQNRTQKFARPPPPTYLFDKTSLVQEYSDGQLSVIQQHVTNSELSLVFFYAPWCAESHYAKTTIELLAEQFSNEVYFAAVNCWQPGGECKMQYPRVDSWPILMAYYPKGLAVQYNGHWNLKSVSSFLQKLLNPVQRIETKSDLLKSKLNNYAVVIGFFPASTTTATTVVTSSSSYSDKYQIFFQAAIKSLEINHLHGIEYAIVTGATIQNFNITTSNPVIEMHSLNTTVIYEENSSTWTVDGINNWIKRNFDIKNTWVEITGKKSWNLSNYLKKTPTLLAFHPRNFVKSYNDAYYMLRQVAFTYNNCELNQSLSGINSDIKSLREENLKQRLALKLKCFRLKNNFLNNQENSRATKNNCNVTELLMSNTNIFDSAKNTNTYNNNNNYYCPCNQQYQLYHANTANIESNSSPHNNNFEKKRRQNINFPIDTKSPLYLLQKSLEHKCWKLSLIENQSDYSMDHEINANFTGLGCKFNRTLSFVMADSDLYNYMMKSLGVNNNDLKIRKSFSKPLIFIIDKEEESTFQMKEEISIPTITKFIENFHNNSLSRKLRNKLYHHYHQNPLENSFQIKEINSKQLRETIKFTNKSIVVLFYSSQCALCSLLSRILLNIGKILKSSNIDVYRIDGENNDFPWEYIMDSFPTLLVMPRRRQIDTRIYPRNVQISTRNILRFIFTTLDRIERLRLLVEICWSYQTNQLFPNCMKNLRIEITNGIGDYLYDWRQRRRRWRHQQVVMDDAAINSQYSSPQNETKIIMNKLQILHKIYYITLQMSEEEEALANLKKTIVNLIVILGDS